MKQLLKKNLMGLTFSAKHFSRRNVKTPSLNLLSPLPAAKQVTIELLVREIWNNSLNNFMFNIIDELTNKRIRKLQENYSPERNEC